MPVRPTDEYPFIYGEVHRERAALPARFAAPLPASLEELSRTGEHPPLSQVASRVCRGDSAALDRIVDALRRADASGNLSPEFAKRYLDLFPYCGHRERRCDLLARTLEAEPRAGVRAVLIQPLSRCGMAVRSIIERQSTPNDVVIDWYFEANFHTRFPSLTNRFAKAIEATAKLRKGVDLRTLAVALGRVDDPAVVELVQRLGRNLDAESRAWLAIGFERHPAANARGLYQAACKHPRLADDMLCERNPARDAALAAQPTLDEQSRSLFLEVEEWLQQNPGRRDELLSSLLGCVDREADTYLRSSCLANLARADWRLARTRAAGFQSDDSWYHYEVTAALRDFASPDALRAEIARLGWRPAKHQPPGAAANPIRVRDVLESLGRVHSFDLETDQFPNEHDVLLDDLAELADGDLRGAAFEETPPGAKSQPVPGEPGLMQAPQNRTAPYHVRGYHRGWRYEIDAGNFGDWYDLEAVLGLLNVMLRDAGSNLRYASLKTGDQFAHVVVGPMAALGRAFRAGWLLDENAGAARDSGRAAEEALLQLLSPDGGVRPTSVLVQ